MLLIRSNNYKGNPHIGAGYSGGKVMENVRCLDFVELLHNPLAVIEQVFGEWLQHAVVLC